MNDPVRYDIIDDVAVVTIDSPPVNAMTRAVWDGLDRALARALAAPDAAAILLRGAGATFPAGADLRLFDTLHTHDAWLARAEVTHGALRRIEDSPKPVIAAIHGHALGGGLELALACHLRLATPDASLGQPEVRFGIIPGAGGTQRLPRLCGGARALSLCVTGRPIGAEEALAAGLIDALVPDVAAAAIAAARAHARAGAIRRTREIALDADRVRAGLDACAAMRAARPVTPGTRAVHAAIDAVEAGLTLGFDAGSQRERELFATCVMSPESRALRGLFFAERAAGKRADAVPPGEIVPSIAQAAIVGAGTMGAGIAIAYADAGLPVLLKELDAHALDRAMAGIRRHYAAAQARQRLTAEEADRRLARITPTTQFDAFVTADIVIEAIVEAMDEKRALFAELAAVTRPDCLLASNTSTLDIDELAAASGRPAQVVGHHFFNPAPVNRLLEIVHGAGTSAATVAASFQIARRLGKIGVLVGNGFGFVGNRMLAPYLRESHLLLEEGAQVSQIDAAATGFGMAMGPLAVQDLVGLDVGARVRAFCRATGQRWADGPLSALPDRLVELGRLGRKTGAGWYRYDDADGRVASEDARVEALAGEAARARGVTRRAIADDEIVERLLFALINAGAALLDSGRARHPGDIDVIYVHGYGFPPYRGGPMAYADTQGMRAVCDGLERLRARLGDHWSPSPLIARLAAEGRRFADWD